MSAAAKEYNKYILNKNITDYVTKKYIWINSSKFVLKNKKLYIHI